jgi:hypothetical protein
MFRAFVLSLSIFLTAMAPAVAADRFVSVIEDLPLMEGLNENENAAVTFDSAGGRIAEAEARGNADPAKVRRFYADVLPQLGWSKTGDGLYERERERLKLTIDADGDGGAVIGFSVSPISD